MAILTFQTPLALRLVHTPRTPLSSPRSPRMRVYTRPRPPPAPSQLPRPSSTIVTYRPPPLRTSPIPYCYHSDHLAHISDVASRVWYLGVASRNKVLRALELLEKRGGDKGRVNVMAAAIVADLQMDCETVCCAILKGVCVKEEEVGKEVMALLKTYEKVEGVTKVKGEWDTVRELMVATVEDERAMCVELAAVVVEMRRLGKVEEDRRKLYAAMAMDLYAPLAHQLGFWLIQSELEELAFMYLHPREYDKIKKLVALRLKESKDRLQQYKEQLERAICGSSKVVNKARHIRVKGRVKGTYSIYRKMKRSHKQIDEIYDLLALRVLVQPRGVNEEDEHEVCYDIFEAVKREFRTIDGRYKDYIASPKANGYKSLHATIKPGRGLPPIEIQIRTEKMHHVAEFGAAAHWMYQEDARRMGYERTEMLGTKDDEDDGNGKIGRDIVQEFMQAAQANALAAYSKEQQVVQSGRTAYLRCWNAAIRGSWVIVNAAGRLYKMAVGSTLRDLATGMGIASFNVIAMVNGNAAPLSQRLEMNDMVCFLP